MLFLKARVVILCNRGFEVMDLSEWVAFSLRNNDAFVDVQAASRVLLFLKRTTVD